jgi:tetratricopeptide (TPR) repeat protein
MTRAPVPEVWHRRLTEAIARNSAGHPAAAEKAFSRLLRAIQQAGDGGPEAEVVRARAHLGRAVSVFDQRGDLDSALRDIETAAALARRADAPHVLVAVLGQRGLISLSTGHTSEALVAFDAAAELLDQAEPFDQMCILLNRGALHLEHGALAPAKRDLTRCAAIATAAGDHVLEFKARHNLGYVEFLAGNLPRALAEMAAAAAVDSGGPWPTALLDRARVLREAGLLTEADANLRTAQALFRARRVPQGVGETLLARAECALAASPSEAAGLATQAGRIFRRRRNVRWERKAEHVALLAQLARARDGVSRPGRVADLADAFAQTCAQEGRDDLARSARLIAADAVLLTGAPASSGRPAGTRATSAEVSVSAGTPAGTRAATSAEPPAITRRDSLAVRLLTHEVRARAASASGDTPRARAQVRLGLAEVRAYQARFGSLDMRTASAVHGVALAGLDLEIALGTGRPSAVFASLERTRATSSRLAPVRPPRDDDAAALLAELRVVEEDARGLEGSADGTKLRRLRARAAELRSAVRAGAWQREGTRDRRAVRETVSLRSVRARLDDAGYALVSLAAHRGQWHAVVVDGPRVEHHVLRPVAQTDELVRRIRSDLDALALPMIPSRIRRSVTHSLHTDLAALDVSVLAPLGVAGRNLVVSPSGLLAVVPWGLLPSRRGLPVVVSPSASSWFDAAGREPDRHPGRTERPTRVACVAGPGLTKAVDEAKVIAGMWSGTAMTGPDASTGAVLHALGTNDVVHVAAHGRHEPESPLFSSLRMADGPLFAHELDSVGPLASCLVLSACEVGLWTVRPGNEPLGLTNALLQLGARSVVAGVARVADSVATDVMVSMHRLMAGGTDSATALARAQLEVPPDGAPAPFVCSGSGWVSPTSVG